MELDEMKSLWADLSLQVEKQDKIQKKLLMEITKQKFRNKLNAVRIPEILGSFICVGYAMYLLSQFSNLELWYNQIFALISIFIMIALPAASLTAIKGMRSVRIDLEAPATILDKFNKSKIRFWKVQRYGLIFGAILLITIIPPLTELNGSIEKIQNPLFWIFYIPAGVVFMFLLTRFVYKKYKGTIEASEKMLSELD
ncbi:hypothetical protein [Algoriphagus aquimarinus]|uniref:DUF3278 domain-containing protein n=1 Tax=Algoriphagus aquimarinus TaxID=237018 RepID=A0A1I0XN57_9BACT|nr:hypothetical protein [Algoriphagus aquimarinus]SFB01730.1 hypothetical protein SAMN04489723_103255 [Algoriphagus aquimarinus]|tara:strand:+ start:239486 stop:240079 length:594 start_codon:yes stop_codon:yes gene_type:complete